MYWCFLFLQGHRPRAACCVERATGSSSWVNDTDAWCVFFYRDIGRAPHGVFSGPQQREVAYAGGHSRRVKLADDMPLVHVTTFCFAVGVTWSHFLCPSIHFIHAKSRQVKLADDMPLVHVTNFVLLLLPSDSHVSHHSIHCMCVFYSNCHNFQ